MTTTRQLPTDKHGNVYYGPRTYAQAVHEIEVTGTIHPLELADKVESAGYTGVARRIRRHFGV